MISLPKITIDELANRYTTIVSTEHYGIVHLLQMEPEVYELDYEKENIAGWVYLFPEWDIALIGIVRDTEGKAKENTIVLDADTVRKVEEIAFDISLFSCNNAISYEELRLIFHYMTKGLLKANISLDQNKFLYR